MTRTARTYGGALYDLALEEQLTQELLAQLDGVCAVFAGEPDYLRLLCTPSIAKDVRRTLLDEAWQGRVHPYILNFMKLLCDNGTLRELSGCAREFRRRYNADNGIVEVRAVTAVELKPALREKLQKKLEAVTGKQIELHTRVDADVIGGVRLELAGEQLDDTVACHLAQVQKLLKSTAV